VDTTYAQDRSFERSEGAGRAEPRMSGHGACRCVGLTMIAGMMSGNCMLPIEFAPTMEVGECLAGVQPCVVSGVLPWTLAFSLV